MNLYPHQLEGLAIGTVRNQCFFWECGCGKTLLGIKLAEHFRPDGPTLVVCPLSIIKAAWMEDIARFSRLKAASLWYPSGAKKDALIDKALAENHDIYIINFEAVAALHTKLDRKGFACIIVDESSKLKTFDSKITRAMLSFAGFDYSKARNKNHRFKASLVPHRYCLTGTPAPTSRMQYWGQVKFVTGFNDKVLPCSFWAFKNRYFYDANKGKPWMTWPDWKFIPELEGMFNGEMRHVSHRVEKADVLDLPEQIHQVRSVLLSQKERTAYTKMARMMMVEAANGLITASNALSKINKLRQLTSGFAYISMGEEQGRAERIGTSKEKELLDLLDEIGDRQVIIWANYREEIESLFSLLSRVEVSVLYSGVKDRNEEIQRFLSGQAQYLIAHPLSAGHGLTFTNCSHQVYFSLSYDYEQLKQSQDRIHRIGTTSQCNYYYLLAQGTIDEEIYRVLHTKEDVSNSVLSYLKGVASARMVRSKGIDGTDAKLEGEGPPQESQGLPEFAVA